MLGREPDFDDKSMLMDSPKPSKRRMLAKCVSPMLGFDHHSISQNFINNAYNFVKELSHSRLGSVYKATKRTQSGDYQQDKYYAIRILHRKLNVSGTKQFEREIELMRVLDHYNLMRFYECFQNETTIYAIYEYLEGETLDGYVLNSRSPMHEQKLKSTMFQIVQVIHFLHLRGIAHRDIDPDNFMFVAPGSDEIKLIDLGNAKLVDESTNLKQMTCDVKFAAPEVIKKQYGKKADIWAIGVCMYYFMTTGYPFDDDFAEEIPSLITSGTFDHDSINSSDYSKEAKDFLFHLLTHDPNMRPSSLDCLLHPWFTSCRRDIIELGEASLQKEMFLNLRTFGYRSEMQREVRSLLIQSMGTYDPEVANRINVFRFMDKDFSGAISATEIEEIYKKFDIKLREREIEEIIDSLYFKEKAVVTYLEFIAATLDKEFYRNKQRIRELFNYIDVDLSGEIDYQDIQDCFKRFGRLLDDSKIRRMIAECDVNKDERINFEEFYNIIVAERKRSIPAK